MKIKHTLIFSISLICFFLFSSSLYAQKDSLNYYPRTYGLRIGADILRPVLSITNKNYKKGLEIVADYRIKSNLYIAGEAGYSHKNLDEDLFNYDSEGTYLKFGLNKNVYVNWLNMDNEIYFGFRYGTNIFNTTINHYTIFQQGIEESGAYFEPKTISTPLEQKNLNAHWVELVLGIKVETFKNLFLGVMVNVNQVIISANSNNFETTYMPGFGSISEGGTGSNINYTITYRIPIYKK